MDIYTEYLSILELSEGASLEDIKDSYRELVQIWHPDKCGNNENLKKRATEKLKKLNEAYNYLIENYTNDYYCEYSEQYNEDIAEKYYNFDSDMVIDFPYSKRKNYYWVKFFITYFITMLFTVLILN